MPYVPDATDVNQPDGSVVKAATAAAEFKTIKLYMRDTLLAGITGLSASKADKNNAVLTGVTSIAAANIAGNLTVGGVTQLNGLAYGQHPAAGSYDAQLCTTKFAVDLALSAPFPGAGGAYGLGITSDGASATWGVSVPDTMAILTDLGF